MDILDEPVIPLAKLLDQVHLTCLAVPGRLRRLNAFMLAHHLVMASVETVDREAAAEGLLRIARECELLSQTAPQPSAVSRASSSEAQRPAPRKSAGTGSRHPWRKRANNTVSVT